ncbi:MAG: shikimate dehydrogenase [Pelosinus sp.]|nr:shikimate dehydrogenase [Pelosinus sp.]
MITGNTKKVGIIGWPVGHSLSPAMHNAAFAAAGLDYVYVPLAVQPGGLKEAVDGLRALGFIGANVTIPHKVEVMQYLDEIDRTARSVGAVNTIVVKEGKCIGYNTDAQGFVEALRQQSITVEGKQAVLFGAGGAARAVVAGLFDAGIKKMILGVRNPSKAEVLSKDFTGVSVFDWYDNAFVDTLAKADILINCTPLGMAPNLAETPPVVWQRLNRAAAVCDLIYNPPLTKFLAAAKQQGHVTLNGEGMLIGQGAVAFRLWTGRQPDISVMAYIFKKKLKK